MRGDAAGRLEALEALSGRALTGLTAHGYVRIEPGILQPADVYLDVIGEELRARSYVFTDLDGEELCLRPDLTVPACRLYVERHPDADAAARWCYDGPAFRFQPAGATPAQPREFRQIGLESFNAADREEAEAEVLLLMVQAVAAAGLAGTHLRMGDLGLFRALLDGLPMPDRWRLRLMRELWHRERFRDLLSRLASGAAAEAADLPPGLLDALDPGRPEAAEETVAGFLERAGTPLIGVRSLAEIATSLLETAADRREPPLARAAVEAVEGYLAIRDRPAAAIGRISGLARAHGVDLARPLAAFERRLRLIGEGGLDPGAAEFSAEFGRDLEYYTGFVFQIEVPGLGRAGQVAGGGRYDDLVQAVGGAHAVPAVGAAVHTDRLLELAGGRAP